MFLLPAKKAYLISLLLALCLLRHPPSLYALEGTLNPNTASSKQLQALPFVGKTKAKAIIKCRKLKGAFLSVDDIKECPEIGSSTFEAIKPYLKLSGPTTLNQAMSSDGTSQKSDNYRFIPKILTRPGEIMILENAAYYDTLLNFIAYAENRIDIALFIFKTTSSPKNKPSLIIKALADAKKRGVAINVLLEKSDYDDNLNKENEQTAKLLHKKGIKVLFDKPKTTTHSKLVIVDNRFSFVGSHNFTHSALTYNNELSLLVDSPALALELQRYIKRIVQ